MGYGKPMSRTYLIVCNTRHDIVYDVCPIKRYDSAMYFFRDTINTKISSSVTVDEMVKYIREIYVGVELPPNGQIKFSNLRGFLENASATDTTSIIVDVYSGRVYFSPSLHSSQLDLYFWFGDKQ